MFQPGKTYYLFPLFAKSSTKQVFQMYVGKDPTWNPATSVGMTRAVIDALPLGFTPGAWPSTWTRTYDSGTGILTVSMDMSFPDFATAYAAAAPGLCRPFSFCGWNAQTSKCQCALPATDPLYGEWTEKNAAGDDAICSFAVKDFACPSGGCFGSSVTLSSNFATDPAVDPRPAAVCYPCDANWNVTPGDASSDLAGSCYDPPMAPADFCKTRVRTAR